MSRGIRARLGRLERKHAPCARPFDWDWFRSVPPDDPDLVALLDEAAAEVARLTEESTAGKLYRQELARLGLPHPASLRGIDVVEEAIRLVSTPGPNGNDGADPC